MLKVLSLYSAHSLTLFTDSALCDVQLYVYPLPVGFILRPNSWTQNMDPNHSSDLFTQIVNPTRGALTMRNCSGSDLLIVHVRQWLARGSSPHRSLKLGSVCNPA